MKKEIRAWLIIVSLNIISIGACLYDATVREPAEQEVLIESTEDIIHWKIDGEVTVETLDIEIVEKPALESLGEFKLTAYCPCTECSGKWGYQTSTGAVATEGRTVAVDPTVIPYGTVLIINDHEYVAEDCGGAIKGNDIDIFIDCHEEADEFGIQYAEVYVWQ